MNWEQLFMQIGMVLLLRWLGGKKDSAEIEKEIYATTDKNKMIELVAGKVVANLMKVNNIELDSETAETLNSLVKARKKEDLVEIIAKPETKAGIADFIGGLLSSIFGIFK